MHRRYGRYRASRDLSSASTLTIQIAIYREMRFLEHHVGHVFVHVCRLAHAARLYSPPYAPLRTLPLQLIAGGMVELRRNVSSTLASTMPLEIPPTLCAA